jgi:hypothetical protein
VVVDRRGVIRSIQGALLAACLVFSTSLIAQVTIPQPVAGQTNDWPVTKIIGVPVYNAQNQAIGQISDLLMDQQARVATAILSVGGYLGVGDRLVQVPLSLIRFPKDAAASNIYPERALLNTTRETLAGMPEFKY